MRRFFILTIFLIINLLTVNCASLDSLLMALDNAIKERPQYAQKREFRIDSLKIRLNQSTDLELQYHIFQKLFKEYRNYNMDSALSVSYKKYDIAKKIYNQEYILISEMNTSEILGIMGMYKESLDIIDKIDKHKLDKKEWSYYYHLYHSIYSLLAENSLSQKEKDYYKNLISQYKDSLLQTNDPQTLGYHLVENGKLVELGKYNEALELMTRCYNENKNNESLLGTLSYGLSDVYEKLGDSEQQKKYLTISSIADLKRSVKSYIALRKLAVLLYQEGDVVRAYAYVKCAMEDAMFSRARFRTLEISETLPIIVAAYDKKAKQEKENLFKYLILISVLSCVLIVSIIYIYKQLKKLSHAKYSMKALNKDLRQMNEDLNELNKKLSESNLVKEEYIGSVFNLCSTYIDKLEGYRININRKLKTGQIDEALKTTNSTSLVADELKEFFRNFDVMFLNIYPNFIEEFNNLLQEGERIYPKADDILPPELRVFALIRLGINDSSKIASFLHYSPQTVYNYKLKIRNKLAISKDEFALAIQQIGK
ncbi:MAG: DUF6377 domain-containing protein [Dysgonomonas sp.]